MTDSWLNLAMGAMALTALTLAGGALLSFAVRAFRVEGNPLVDSIDAVLPQTQCGQCGHPGCRPYAEAISNGEAINRCPPGGQDTVDRLAELLGVESLPLDADPETAAVDRVAVIIEEDCIGCTKCIKACPVDAILGAAKLMHTVLPDLCTGCDLCIAPCPVDCIEMVPRTPSPAAWIPTPPSLICSDQRPSTGAAHG